MAQVLLIDDSEFALELVKEMLEQLGHRVQATGLPEEFLRLAVGAEVALVDAVMPEMTGEELIELLRNSGNETLSNLPVIIISALEGQTVPGQKVWLLPKPFGNEELDEAIKTAMQG